MFYFGLIGAHYGEDNISAILRHISVYERMRYPFRHSTHTFKYVQEIGWTSKKLNRLLDSAGIIVNSTLYISDTNFYDLEYIAAHADIPELRLEVPGCKGYMYLNQKMFSCAQWKSCLETDFYRLLGGNLHTYRGAHRSCLYTLRCLHSIFTNLRSSVHIDLVDSFSTVIKGMGKYLNSLNLTHGPVYCESLSNYIKILKDLPRKYIILVKELDIQIKTLTSLLHRSSRDGRHGSSRHFDPDSCFRILTSLLKEIKHYKLQKLIFTRPKDGSLAKSYVLQDTICELKELQTLGLHSVGPYEVQRLLPCLPPTLQELSLCENDITDQNVIMIARGLKHLHELKSLSLCDNSIEGGSLKSLMETLISHREFSSLDLSYNHLDNSDGIKALGSLHSLHELKIKGSRVDIKELVTVLVSNKIRLHSLHITGKNSIGLRSLLPIAHLDNLHHLDISERLGVEIEKPLESDLLIEILKNLTKLESFKLCDKKWLSLIMNDSLGWSIKSIHLARLISHHLPHLRLFQAPCLHVTID